MQGLCIETGPDRRFLDCRDPPDSVQGLCIDGQEDPGLSLDSVLACI